MMGYIYVGVDQSANHTGVVAVQGSQRVIVMKQLIEPVGIVGLERLVYIRERLTAILDEIAGMGDIKAAAHEAYSLRSTNRPFLLGEVGCIVQLALVDAGLPVVHAVPPTSLKKFLAGHGSTDKEGMKRAAGARSGVTFTDDNLADAYALSLFAAEKHDPQTTRRNQLEVLAGFVKSKKSKPFRSSRDVL